MLTMFCKNISAALTSISMNGASHKTAAVNICSYQSAVFALKLLAGAPVYTCEYTTLLRERLHSSDRKARNEPTLKADSLK